MNKLIIYLSFVSLLIFGCKKETVREKVNNVFPYLFTSDSLVPNNGIISFACYRYASGDNSRQFQIHGAIYSDTGYTTSINAGTLSIGGLNFSSDASMDKQYGNTNIDASDSTPAKSIFGATSKFKIAGNSGVINSDSVSFYVPAEIMMTSPTNSQLTISKSSSLTVQWNTDGSNTEGVYLMLRYNGALSHAKDSSLSSTDIIITHYSSSDGGSYTFSSGDLSSLPVGGILEVYVGRSGFKYLNTTDNNSNPMKIRVFAYTMATNSYTISG